MKYHLRSLSVNAEIFHPFKSIEDYEKWFQPYVGRIHHDGEIYRYEDLHGNFTTLYEGDYFVDNFYHNDPYIVHKHKFERDYELDHPTNNK